MRADEFNLRHLRAFVKTCELGTLLAASNAVHLSQPALTQGLKRLESQLGVALFVRESDGMQATPAGLQLLPRARAALRYIRSARVTQTQVRGFVSLARHGSYAQASAATGNASASLHRAVRDLEAALDVSLVQRSGRAVKLTEVGQATARRFRLGYVELEAALDELQQLSEEGQGRIAIGAMPLCRARLLPATIIDFRAGYPKCNIRIAEGAFSELVEPLRDGELDILIGALRNTATFPDLRQWPLFEDRPVVLARAGHPLADRPNPSAQELAEFEWCLPPTGAPLRDQWGSIFEDAGVAVPDVRLECGSVLLARQILLATDCLTALSEDQVAMELEDQHLTVISSTPPSLTRTIGVTCRHDWRPTRIQDEFLARLKVNAAR